MKRLLGIGIAIGVIGLGYFLYKKNKQKKTNPAVADLSVTEQTASTDQNTVVVPKTDAAIASTTDKTPSDVYSAIPTSINRFFSKLK